MILEDPVIPDTRICLRGGCPYLKNICLVIINRNWAINGYRRSKDKKEPLTMEEVHFIRDESDRNLKSAEKIPPSCPKPEVRLRN